MKIEYLNEKVEELCTSVKAAKKLFGGDEELVEKLQSRIRAFSAADTLKDIINQPSFHFHKLYKKGNRKLDGYFAVDLKSRKESWRIIIQPLDSDEKPYDPCNIDEIAGFVRIIEISEVSKHYE